MQHFMWPNIYYLIHKTLPLDRNPRQSKPRILALCVHYIPTLSDIIQLPKSDWSLQIISHLHNFRQNVLCAFLISHVSFQVRFKFAQLSHCRNTSSTEQVMSELVERL
jgi:hypothetical protein